MSEGTAAVATLTAVLDGFPPKVVLGSSGVQPRDWYELALAMRDESPRSGPTISIGVHSFLGSRLRLRDLLNKYGINFAPSPAVIELLQQQVADNRSIREAAAYPDDPDDLAVEPAPGGISPLVMGLRNFQRRDLAKLLRLRHGANFSVPGAGKTRVTYALFAQERARGRVTKLLVVAPLSAFGAWTEEALVVPGEPLSVARWQEGGAFGDVVLINYQRLNRAVPRLAEWMLINRVHLVVDEAHRAKRGSIGEWGKALLELAPLAARRDILTGTPAPNHPRDLRALLDILWPGGVVSGSLPADALRKDPLDSSLVSFNRAIRPLYVRTTKIELALPPVSVVPVPVPMSAVQQDIYNAMLSRYAGMFDLDRVDAAAFAVMGDVMMYLLQAASSPKLLGSNSDPRAYRYPSLAIPAGSRLAGLVDSYADLEVPAKIERACRIVHANALRGRKTLVWSNFPGNLLDLERQLEALQPALVYGAIPSADDAEPGVRTREREIERFKTDPNCAVLLANPAAMSEGVSLHTVCNDAVYVERTFNAGQYLQSLDRIHRLGLHQGVQTRVSVLISQGSIDEQVSRRLEVKTTRLSRLLDDPGLVQLSLPDEDYTGEPIDEDLDLAAVLEHLAHGLPQIPIAG